MLSAGGQTDSAARSGSIAPGADTSAEGPSPWVGVDWRGHQRWVDVNGRPVNVIDMGSGDPVLFVHGLGGSWPNWLEQMPVISQDWRAIALDLPGFGHSPMPRDGVSIDTYARTIVGLLDALDLRSAVLVGNSMGGEISAELAISHPERVSKLVLVSPAGVSTGALMPRMPLIRRAHPALQVANRWIAANAETIARRPRLRHGALATVAAQPSKIPATFASEQLKGMGKPGFLPALESIVSHSQSLRERLAAIDTRTLIVWGEKDPLIPVRDADVFESQIKGAHKVVWQDTGHVAMFERGPEFNALLEGFLSG